MRKTTRFLIALAFLAGAPAGAATLSFTFVVGNLPPPTLHGSGATVLTPPGLPYTIPAGVFGGNPQVVVPISPTFVGLTNVTIPANSVNNPGATFDPGGAMGLSGAAFFNSGAHGTIPLFPIGGGGTGMGFLQSIPIKLFGGAWQYAAHKVFTGMGAALSNAVSVTATAYDNRTAGGDGVLQLVSAGYLHIAPGAALGNLPVFGVLNINYTPEPGTLLLLGSGVAVLAAIGRRRIASKE
jgi:hypothetical protein